MNSAAAPISVIRGTRGHVFFLSSLAVREKFTLEISAGCRFSTASPRWFLRTTVEIGFDDRLLTVGQQYLLNVKCPWSRGFRANISKTRPKTNNHQDDFRLSATRPRTTWKKIKNTFIIMLNYFMLDFSLKSSNAVGFDYCDIRCMIFLSLFQSNRICCSRYVYCSRTGIEEKIIKSILCTKILIACCLRDYF